MKKLYLIAVLATCFAGTLFAQPKFDIDNTTGDPGGVVSVNFKVRDFTDIVGMQFSIQWDPNILSFSSLDNITSGIRDFDAGALNTDAKWTNDGNIIVSWFDTGANPNTLPDGSIIFTINFNIVGGAGSTTTVTIVDEPRKIEIIDSGENNVGLQVNGGVFTASGTGGGASIRLIGSDEMGAMGENICVEVSVQGFDNISGMQFSLNWDPTFLSYTGVGAFDLSGLTEGSFNADNTGEGKLGLQWLDPSSSGITLANGSRIFQVCFDIIGSNGSRSVQFTNDPVAIEVIDGDDMRVTFTKKDGTVTIEGDPGGGTCDEPGFALSASSENADPGAQVCVDFNVKGFTLITTLSTTIEWDPAILSNPQIGGLNLSGLTEGTFNLDQGAAGKASLAWFDPDTDGVTLADGTKIFEICFDVIGTDGQNSSVVFTDDLTAREVSSESAAIDFHQCDGNVQVGNDNADISCNITTPTCRGGSDGAINITVNAGTAPYTYVWTKDGAAAGTSEDLTNITAGTYVVVATDALNVQFNKEVIVGDPAGVTINDATIVDATDGSNGSIALSLSGGATPLTFAWSNGATTRDIAGLAGGTYQVTITEANGCTLESGFAVGGGEFAVSLNIKDYNGVGISCFGENDGQITAVVSGGSSPFTYAWSKAGETGNIIGDLEPGNYSVTITDATGATVSATGEVTEPGQMVVTVNTTPSPNDVEGTATAVVNGGTAPYTYSWTAPGSPRTRVIINLPRGSYNVIVTDANGCQASGIGDVDESDRECFTSVPIMSPNGDARNDFLNFACVEGTDNELEVYNRHGELVFEATNYNNDWMGIDTNGEELPDGAYYWVIRVRRNGILEQNLGHVTILRTLN
ncbi:MAG: T9SS type B sorting domain-containing protein [Saprospiraceae bacterium]|nr:T9SS type B sorting domain-containing protein [Saprospiraceae bacterium]